MEMTVSVHRNRKVDSAQNFELLMAKKTDLICVVHAHPTATSGEVVHLPLLGATPIRRRENNLEFSRLVDDKVGCSVLCEETAPP